MSSSFKSLKVTLTSPPVLTYTDFAKPFIVETDSPWFAVRAILGQKDNEGVLQPVQYAIRTMNSADKNYTLSEKRGFGGCLSSEEV